MKNMTHHEVIHVLRTPTEHEKDIATGIPRPVIQYQELDPGLRRGDGGVGSVIPAKAGIHPFGGCAERIFEGGHEGHEARRNAERQSLFICFGFVVFVSFVVNLSLSMTVFAQDGAAILKKVDAVLQPESFESYRKLINIEPNGAKREFLLFTLKKGHDKIVSLFMAPASEKGRATLRLGDNMWLYIPNVGKPVRITSLQSVIGGVFNNADIMRLDYHIEYDVKNLEQKPNEYVLELKAKSGAVAYDQVKMVVDKKTFVPSKIECYAATGLLIKALYLKESKPFDDATLRPSVIETDSPLYKGYQSIMVYSRVKKRVVSDEVFTLEFLSKIDTIR